MSKRKGGEDWLDALEIGPSPKRKLEELGMVSQENLMEFYTHNWTTLFSAAGASVIDFALGSAPLATSKGIALGWQQQVSPRN
ncbi:MULTISPECIES: hypothetical protein [Pyrobaculum]|uniref:Uncharacterized protein n=2 Tax=Pyrobaculum arsenaticum TaxID=121277 RepID=A4WK32_PYRAR|nr:hypothetical protein [Pyrobaculum arsenaticum]ABP50749.1 hypothetical protein Pars_1178 [Pyrobaculum arsenaticum DSM 13514]MCY0891246.1 hypothetical protein [Pyrobaculum arsenaticum]NYR15535.1 hypothetical protein [Pyrobaculum arsenaticum]